MRTLHATIFALLLFGAYASAQRDNYPILSPPVQNTPPSQPGAPTSIGGVPLGGDAGGPSPDALHRVEVLRANERMKKMAADTDRLLALATELKADMDKTSRDTISIQVIKKADEIEKLAHDIKQRMKN